MNNIWTASGFCCVRWIALGLLSTVVVRGQVSFLQGDRGVYLGASGYLPAQNHGSTLVGDYSYGFQTAADDIEAAQSSTFDSDGVQAVLQVTAVGDAQDQTRIGASGLYADFTVSQYCKYSLSVSSVVSATNAASILALELGKASGSVPSQFYVPQLNFAGISSPVAEVGAFRGGTLSSTGILEPGVWRFGASARANSSAKGVTKDSLKLVVDFEITPLTAASISTQPQGSFVAAGANLTLFVAAKGDFLSYQWTKDGVAIAGATSSSLSLANVQAVQAGTYGVTVSNPLGSINSAAAEIKIATARAAITQPPTGKSYAAGENILLSVTAVGDSITYQWSKDGVAISGATTATLSLNNVGPAQAGSYTVTVSNPLGSATSSPAEIKVATTRAAITQSPVGKTYFAGENVVLSVTATGDLVAYQWSKDGVAIPGATDTKLTLSNVGANQAGSYTVTVSNPLGSVTSMPAVIAIGSRLLNVSSRTAVGTGGDILICGFVISGSSSRRVLVRAAGPRLGDFGVPDILQDPKLAVFDAAGKQIATNDDWSADGAATTQQLRDAYAAVGAFPFVASSKDSAILTTLSPGAYTIQVSGANDTAGVALVEVYDSAAASSDSTFANLSTRAVVGTGGAILIQGLVVDGSTPKRLLVRAVGPRLADFGLAGVLADPLMKVVDSAGTVVASNDNWSSGDAASVQSISNAAASVGAFTLLKGSKDSALIVTLPAGSYTIQVSGVGDTTGSALVEVYSL